MGDKNNPKKGEIVIVTRSQRFRNKCSKLLANEKLHLTFVETEEELMRKIRARKVGLVIVKSGRSEPECHHVINLIKETNPAISVLLSADYFNFWSDFGSWVADACIVETGDMAELRSAVHDYALSSAAAEAGEEEFPVDWA